MMNSTWTATILMAIMLGGTIVWIASHRYWSERHRQMLEAAAGGAMSTRARDAYQRRDRHRIRWMIIGPLAGLSVGALAITTGRQSEGLALPLMISLALGQYAGSIASGFAVIKDVPSRRVATLKPRVVNDYVEPSQLMAERVSLLLPLGVVVLSAIDLFSSSPVRLSSVGILAAGLVSLGAGVAAPAVRNMLLRTPNTAESKEVAFWNNAIVSRAVGDLTLAVIMLSVVTGLAGLWSPTLDLFPAPVLFALWGISALIMFGVVVAPALITRRPTSSIPTFITRHAPQPRSAR